MKGMDILTTTLLVVGGLNWGLVGIAGFDLVAAVLGPMSLASRAVYGLVGLSAAYQAVRWTTARPRTEPVAAHA